MSTVELREKLINKILHTENPALLGEVFRLLEMEGGEAEVVELSELQKQSILQGQEDIRNGQFLTNEQADKELDEWLSK